MSKMAKLLFPWPWRIIESGGPPNYFYTVVALNDEKVASYDGENARAKAESLIVIGAENNVKKVMRK